jgi:hypothetical protein
MPTSALRNERSPDAAALTSHGEERALRVRLFRTDPPSRQRRPAQRVRRRSRSVSCSVMLNAPARVAEELVRMVLYLRVETGLSCGYQNV